MRVLLPRKKVRSISPRLRNSTGDAKQVPGNLSTLQRKADHSAPVAKAAALQALASTRPTLVFEAAEIASAHVVQRHIDYDGPPHNQFIVDGKRPAFKGAVKQLVAAMGQQRDHIIAFELIQNDLAVMLNNFLAAPANGKQGAWQELADMTDSLYVSKNGNEYTTMTKQRAQLAMDLHLKKWSKAAITARALLSSLNSSIDNVRVGNGQINQSIGENLDADFMQGVSTVPQGGLQVQGNTPNAPNQQLPQGTKYLRLNQRSEEILYNYQMHTTQSLSFVFDLNSNEQLSSVDAPHQTNNSGPVSGLPVVVFDPNNNQDPFCYK